MLRAKPISNVINIVVEVGSFETKIKTKTLFFRDQDQDKQFFKTSVPRP